MLKGKPGRPAVWRLQAQANPKGKAAGTPSCERLSPVASNGNRRKKQYVGKAVESAAMVLRK